MAQRASPARACVLSASRGAHANQVNIIDVHAHAHYNYPATDL